MKILFTYPGRSISYAITGLCIFMMLTCACQAQVCSNPGGVIYGLTSQGNLRPVNVATGVAGSPLTPPLGLGYIPNSNGLGYDPVNGNFYYFQVGNLDGPLFVSFNPSTNQTTAMSQMPYYADVLSAAVNAAGTGYYCLDAGYAVFYYDIAADSWTFIDSVITDQSGTNITHQFKTMYGGDMVFDGTGNLWMVIANDSTYALYMAAGPLPTTSVSSISVTQVIPPTTLYEDGGSIDGIAFDPTGNIYLSTNSDLYFLQNNTTSITHVGSFSMDTASEVMEDLTSCNFPTNTVLHLLFGSFTASLQPNQTVQLHWQYNQPTTSGYSIEHSADGQHWSPIGYEAAADTASSSSYSWLDTHPLYGKNFYRIQLEGPDSTSSYSTISVVQVPEAAVITISPNPVKDMLNIQYNGSRGLATATLYDPGGRRLRENGLSTGCNPLNMGGLSAGLYIVSLQFADGGNYVQKVWKQ